MGATALFGEKYGSTVRVVSMGNFSMELCGGTHASNTGRMGLFKIISESSVAAGIRRIEGTTGYGVLEMFSENRSLIEDTAKELKVSNVNDIAKRAAQLQSELHALKKECEQRGAKLAAAKSAQLLSEAVSEGGVRIIAHKLTDESNETARTICDEIKASAPDAVTVVCLHNGEKITFTCSCGKDAVARGAHAGNILKAVSAITGGKGGGRPDSASSGGKDASKIDEALAAVKDVTLGMLK